MKNKGEIRKSVQKPETDLTSPNPPCNT